MTTLFSCSTVESLTKCLSFWTDPTVASHRLQLFKKCCSMGTYHVVHLLGLPCSCTGPYKWQVPQPFWPIWSFSPCLQLWPRAAPAGALHRLQLFRLLLLLHRGLLHGCRWRSALCDAQVLQRNKMLYHKPLLGSGSFFTVSGARPAFLPWLWGLLFLPHVLSLLSYFCAFFQSTLPEAQPVLLTGSALDRGRLLMELAGTAPGLLRSLSLAIETLLC